MLVKISLKWGLLLGIAVAVGTQILTWLGLGLTNWFVGISILLSIIFVAIAANKVQRLQGGKFTFLNAISLVLLLVLVARLVFQLYMFVYTRYIDPSWVEMVAESWTSMLQNSGATAAQIEAQIQGFRQAYEIVPMFTSALIAYGIPQFFWGFLTALFFVFNLNKRFKKNQV